MPLSAQAIEVLQEVARRVVQYPETVDMGTWLDHDHDNPVRLALPKHKLPRPYCGTTACIAGHGLLVMGFSPNRSAYAPVPLRIKKKFGYDGYLSALADIAFERLLKLDDTTTLYHYNDWPIDTKTAYLKADNRVELLLGLFADMDADEWPKAKRDAKRKQLQPRLEKALLVRAKVVARRIKQYIAENR